MRSKITDEENGKWEIGNGRFKEGAFDILKGPFLNFLF
jgi:hypothetical protein